MRKYIRFRKNKYNAKRSKCNLGHHHPSIIEGQYCNQLQMLKKDGAIKDFEYEKKFELRVNDVLIATHYPDFYVTNQNDEKEIHEVKGMEAQLWNIKRRLFEVLYPDIPYIVIK